MKTYLDMDNYPRREHFEYFAAMRSPYMGGTVEIDVTDFLSALKAKGYPFFLSFLWCVSRAANSVPELRQRIEGGRIAEYVACRSSHTLALPDGTYCYCLLSDEPPLAEFIPYARAEQERARRERSLSDGEDPLEPYFISTTPWFSFTSLIQPVPEPADSNPRFTWGKYFERSGRVILPFASLCNHALVDGLHMGLFLERLSGLMRGV